LLTESTLPLNTPAYARLRERICSDIVAGVWPLGAHMTLAKLSAHYGVSQNPVREALFQLEGDGVVQMRTHRGATIPNVDAEYIANVYDVRGAIERLLKSAAARHATPTQCREIEAAAAAYERAAATGDARAVVAANRAFHAAIYTAARNPVAIAMMEARSTLVDSVRGAVGYGPDRLDQAIRQHRAIVAAIKRHDAERAGARAVAHTEASKRDLLARLAAA
jgi:DNA-binding GntR family transcriptional regulator